MPPRERIIPPAPPTFPPFPSWAREAKGSVERSSREWPNEGRPRTPPEAPGEAGFFAGASLAALHPIARAEHPLGSLWRQRLALSCAAALAGQGGRTEDEAALRDAWYLRRDGDDPGPAGRMLKTWRWLGEHAALRADDWAQDLSAALELRLDEALRDIVSVAAKLAKGQGSAVAAAAEIAAVSLRFRPDSDALALWLADAVLALRLNWPAPVPLIAAHIRPRDLHCAPRHLDGDVQWLTACRGAYANAAAAAADLYADLARRAERLLAVAPKLRGKDADIMVVILIGEDAQAANWGDKPGKTASDRSSRRLFERLVALGAIRELTGRTTFRLYGL
jgi:hypothetical protein